MSTAPQSSPAAPASPTAELAAFAAALRYEDIPPEVVAHTRLCLLDTFGCGLYGATLRWTGILRDTVAPHDPGTPSTVWGTPDRLSAPHAALVNGTAVHAFELDDLHKLAIVHPGSVVTSAALATAEDSAARGADVSGKRLLTAVVAGYEVAARTGMSVGAAHLRQGWHPTGTHGTLGAAAAAGSLLGLDAAGMRDALGTAGSQSAGLMAAQYGSMVKRFHAGRAAQSGVYAALLAERGFAGIAELFEAEYGGYCGTFSPEHDLAPLTAGLGEVWETATIGFKPYSTNGSCHPTIDMLLELHATEGLSAADVAAVRVRCSTATKVHVGWDYEPDSVTTAQMNLPYIVAAVLTDGDAFVDQFTEERVRDPALTALSRLVTVAADPDIDALGDAYRHATRLEITLRDGRSFTRSRDHARGSAAAPLTAADVREKYHKLAAKALPAERAERLAAAVDSLGGHPDDLRALTDALRAPAAPARDPRGHHPCD
ncbi:MmgE/PrpD family protein [Streptomyces sp. NPDC050560]|uniref:MmgE/PrpD family protein n=1 Tax=Streptomyces sp. NPDC050560 TaxID=3365630 RepID=UPI0037B96184